MNVCLARASLSAQYLCVQIRCTSFFESNKDRSRRIIPEDAAYVGLVIIDSTRTPKYPSTDIHDVFSFSFILCMCRLYTFWVRICGQTFEIYAVRKGNK